MDESICLKGLTYEFDENKCSKEWNWVWQLKIYNTIFIGWSEKSWTMERQKTFNLAKFIKFIKEKEFGDGKQT